VRPAWPHVHAHSQIYRHHRPIIQPLSPARRLLHAAASSAAGASQSSSTPWPSYRPGVLLPVPFTLSLSNTGLTRTVLSPTPGLPSCPPSPGRCLTPAPLPRPLAPTLSANATSPDVVDRRPARLSLPRPMPDRPWTLPLTSLGRSSTRLFPPVNSRRRSPPLAAAQLLSHPTQADGYGRLQPDRLLWTPPSA
jgi:hypothetical protein